MISLDNIKNVYFLGIGGIGMSALARWFNANGYKVGGYDKTSTALTQTLSSEGMDIHYDDKVGRIPTLFYQKETSLVIYTPAIPQDNLELIYFRGEEYALYKRSQVLGMLTKDIFTIGIAGTHGKTTTSSMTAHLLKNAGLEVSAFLGGITANYNSNMLIGDKKGVVVIEADEYDRSFLTLYPNMAVVTSTDADHLDIYGNHDSVLESFTLYVNQIKEGGKLFLNHGLSLDTPAHVSKVSYGTNTEATSQASNVRVVEGAFLFDYQYNEVVIKDIKLQLPGFHNVDNACAALSIGVALGIAPELLKQGIETFKGVKRRFEFIAKNADTVYVDDYAHHPAELKAFISSAKALFPNKKLTVFFQPHLFSRTKDFADEFAESLSLADCVYLLDIYPARELPMPGVTSEIVFKNIHSAEKHLITKEQIPAIVSENKFEFVATVGAGDIDKYIDVIKAIIEK